MATNEREKLRDEVREVQLENHRRTVTSLPAEVSVEIAATSATGKTDKGVEIDAFGGYLYVNTNGVARLDEDAALSLRKKIDQSIQTGLSRNPPTEEDADKSVFDRVSPNA